MLTEAVLFAPLMSVTLEPTVAVLVPIPTGAFRTTVIGGAEVMSSTGSVQMMGAVPPQVHVSPLADTTVAPGGGVSTTVIEVACESPALATFRVYVAGCPSQISAGPVMPIERSAWTVYVAVYVAGFGGAVIT